MTIMRIRNRVNLGLRGGLTLSSFATAIADLHGDAVAVTEEMDSGDTRSITYREIQETVARWSASIAARSKPGQPVVIATPNGVDQFLVSLAAARVGRLPAPVNPQMTEPEIRHVISDSGADLVIRDASELDAGKGSRSAPPEPADPDPNSVAALFYTSGTTGKPKGAALTHKALVGQMSTAALLPRIMGGSEILASLPVAHIMGFAVLMAPMVIGAPIYFMTHFSAARVLDVIEERCCSVFIGVPAMYRMMLEAGAESRDLSSVRAWISGADVMPAELARAFKSFGATVTLPGIGPVGEATFLEGYGMVEVGGGVAAKISPPFMNVGLGDSLGMALPGWKLRVVDEENQPLQRGEVGELQVKGPGLLKGYWGDRTSSDAVITPDGWLHTGDLVKTGPMGSVLFQGRSKNVVLSGGYTIYPLEVEADLEEHPAVAESAVLGISNPKLGEVVVAAIRLEPGSRITEEELLEWASERMAHYKAPKQIKFVEDLPRTGTRKVQHKELMPLFSV